MIRLRTRFLAAALLTSVAAAGLAPALAPAPENPGAATAKARHYHAEGMLPGQLGDGRIAFLKAELKTAGNGQ